MGDHARSEQQVQERASKRMFRKLRETFIGRSPLAGLIRPASRTPPYRRDADTGQPPASYRHDKAGAPTIPARAAGDRGGLCSRCCLPPMHGSAEILAGRPDKAQEEIERAVDLVLVDRVGRVDVLRADLGAVADRACSSRRLPRRRCTSMRSARPPSRESAL